MGSFDSIVSNGQNAVVTTVVTDTAQPQTFFSTVTLKSNVAATPVIAVTDAQVGPGKQAFLTNFMMKVNGGVTWLGSVALVRITDTAGNVLVTIPLLNLLGNATIFPNTSGLTLSQGFTLAQGTAMGTGLRVVADANASIGGSDLVVTLQGVIK